VLIRSSAASASPASKAPAVQQSISRI
jgi:hypothetical protein